MTELAVRLSPSGRRTAEVRRQTIISAARTLFARQGFHSTGMAQIARESGVLVGQIYRDFASKEDLIAAVVEEDISEMLQDPAMTGAIDPGGTEALNNWVVRFVTRRMDADTRGFLTAIIGEAARNPRIAAILSNAYSRLRDSIITAAALWAPSDDAVEARSELADFILSIAGSNQHHQLVELHVSPKISVRMVALVEAEIAAFQARYAARAPSGDATG